MSGDTPNTLRQPSFPPFVQWQNQSVGMFANQFFSATDGNAVYLTFLQASPVAPTPTVPTGGSGMVTRPVQDVPMVVLPVAKVILSAKDARNFITGLEQLVTALEQQTAVQNVGESQ